MKKIQGSVTLVTVIRVKGESTLVQYIEGGLMVRKFVPSKEVSEGTVADLVLEQGIPYGYPWEEIDLHFDMVRFANELHNIDIWTLEDLMKSPQKLWSALRATLADNLSAVLEIEKSESTKGVNTNG